MLFDTKQCRTCGLTKALDDFHLNRRAGDLHCSVCKPCAIAIAARWNREHPARRKAIGQLSYLRHRAEIRARARWTYAKKRDDARRAAAEAAKAAASPETAPAKPWRPRNRRPASAHEMPPVAASKAPATPNPEPRP